MSDYVIQSPGSFSPGDMMGDGDDHSVEPEYVEPGDPPVVPENIPWDTSGTPTEPTYGDILNAGEGVTDAPQDVPTPEPEVPELEPPAEPVQPTEATISAIGNIKAGDLVRVDLRNGDAVAMGAAGSGDRLASMSSAASDAAASALLAADEAQAMAEDTRAHFWADANGAHVTSEADGFAGMSTTIGAAGMIIKEDNDIAASFSGAGCNFYAGGDIVASFNANGTQVGNPASGNSLQVTDSGFSFLFDGNPMSHINLSSTHDAGTYISSDRYLISVEVSDEESATDSYGPCGLIAQSTSAALHSKETIDSVVYSSSIKTSTGYIDFYSDAGSIRSNVKQRILWQGGIFMKASQSCTLLAPVSEQLTGIVLVFSQYTNGQAKDYGWNTYYVPKGLVAARPNVKVTIPLWDYGKAAVFGLKELFIGNNAITGHENNTATGTGVLKYTNNAFVLRYVIGV